MEKSETIEVPIHVDVNVPDREAELNRILQLGGQFVETRSDSIGDFSETWTVMRDPEGNGFCIQSPPKTPPHRYIGNVTFSCAEPRQLGAFWAEALGWPEEETDEGFLQQLRDAGVAERELSGCLRHEAARTAADRGSSFSGGRSRGPRATRSTWTSAPTIGRRRSSGSSGRAHRWSRRRRARTSPSRSCETPTGTRSASGSPVNQPGEAAVSPGRDNARVQKYVLSELDSGERVISERIPNVRSVALGFWIGAGSRDETEAKAGASHFIEHLLFKGSHAYTAQQIAEIFDGLGGELNAATSREHTMVYARVPDGHVQTALDVMTDMVFAPSFGDLDSERAVVLEEIAMYEDTPQELVHDLFSEAVFGRHALGRPVIGTADVISSVTKRVLSTYHRQMYAGGNVVIAAAGNIEHNKFLRMLQRAQSQQRPPAGGPRVRRPLVKAPPPGFRFAKKDTEQYHVCLGAPGIARSDRRRFAASILDAILGGSASSRLFQEIREKRGMAYSVYSFASQYTDTGLVGIYVGTRAENLGPCLDIAAEQLADIAAGNLRAEEIARAKENLKGRIMLSMESTANRMSRLGKSLITDTELLSFDRIIAELEAVEADEVAELAGLLFTPEKLSISGIGPSERVFRSAARRINPGVLARAA